MTPQLWSGLALFAVLCGCGNIDEDTFRRDRVTDALREIANPEDAPDIAQMRGFTDFALSRTSGPLLLVEQPSFDRAAFFVPAATNGDVVTFGSDAQSSLAFQGPVLVASRGLGDDLMSSDVGPLPALLAAQQGGSYARVMRYLDGDDRIFALSFDCTLSVGTQVMTEYCGSAGMEFVNEYALGENGKGVAKQWHGDANGELVIRFLR